MENKQLTLDEANRYLSEFAQEQVPLIGICQPKLIFLNKAEVQISMPLNQTTKNHLNSVYFGALAIGADAAGGFLAMIKAKEQALNISLAFKDVRANFFKRPEDDIVFVCKDGLIIEEMMKQAITTQKRINQEVCIDVLCPSLHQEEIVAQFHLTLSIKLVV